MLTRAPSLSLSLPPFCRLQYSHIHIPYWSKSCVLHPSYNFIFLFLWLNCHYHRKSMFIHRRLNKNRFCRLASGLCVRVYFSLFYTFSLAIVQYHTCCKQSARSWVSEFPSKLHGANRFCMKEFCCYNGFYWKMNYTTQFINTQRMNGRNGNEWLSFGLTTF